MHAYCHKHHNVYSCVTQPLNYGFQQINNQSNTYMDANPPHIYLMIKTFPLNRNV